MNRTTKTKTREIAEVAITTVGFLALVNAAAYLIGLWVRMSLGL